MALTPVTKLGPYQIESLLGAGGMGEVYRALDTRLDRIVAIKILTQNCPHHSLAGIPPPPALSWNSDMCDAREPQLAPPPTAAPAVRATPPLPAPQPAQNPNREIMEN
jgi:hypothetical protein